uniref:Uncharacterized protein n=1 Tax=Anguilla anguilla TaxID=7936 RepID=A0A0E9W6N8_ANGAN
MIFMIFLLGTYRPAQRGCYLKIHFNKSNNTMSLKSKSLSFAFFCNPEIRKRQ